MSQIFISYRRVDSSSTSGRIYDRLREEFGKPNLFKDIDNIPAGVDFRDVLRNATEQCHVMLVIIGPQWLDVKSAKTGGRRLEDPNDYVRLEIEAGLKQESILVIPVLVGGASLPEADELPDSIQRLVFNNARSVRDDPDFHRDMDRLVAEISPLIQVLPEHLVETGRKTKPVALSGADSSRLSRNTILGISAILALFLISLLGIALYITKDLRDPIVTQMAQLEVATVTIQAQLITPSITPTVPTPTITPTLPIVNVVETLDAEATIAGRATQYALKESEKQDATASATLWTKTPTPNMTASIDAFRTQQGETATAQAFMHLTSTATLWTKTPTLTPSVTPTASSTPTLSAEQIAMTPVAHNEDWTVVEREFDGVVMVLVPAGRFMMGSDDHDDEKPIHEQVMTDPFWIDKYEVTTSQFDNLDGESEAGNFWRDPTGQRPRESINWFEAQAFCVLRGGRLPTEREWEYAARGPDNLRYPWGNPWDETLAVWKDNSEARPEEVGQYLEGASWVGSLDMIGNVWEWVSSTYVSYPYLSDARHERATDDTDNVRQVARGGAWNTPAEIASTTYRFPPLTRFKNNNIGIRCVRDV